MPKNGVFIPVFCQISNVVSYICEHPKSNLALNGDMFLEPVQKVTKLVKNASL